MRHWNSICDAANVVERVFSAISGWRGALLRMGGLLLPFLVYGVILRSRLPSGLLFAACCSITVMAIPIGLVLWIAYGLPGWLGTMASLAVTLALFALPLLALWSHVGVHPSALGGLLPVSDAAWYYYDARRLSEGHLFYFAARRPLFVGALATLLGLTGQNLQLTLALFVAMNAVACVLLAREIRSSHGTTSAVILVVLLFFFYRLEGGAGTALTENLGLPLGIVGVAMLWRGARTWRIGMMWLGLGLLTLALTARAGAFLVLPALMGGGAWSLRRETWHARRFLAGSAAAIVLSFGLNAGLGRVLVDPASPVTAFSNFSQTLYGLMIGGKGWTQVSIDHPGAREGAETYALAWQAFRAHPMGVIVGSVEMWRQYFPPRPAHAFAFVPGVLQSACYVLSALGVALCIRRYDQLPYMLLLAAAVGHLVSIPLVPPIDAGLRVYAATIPILALLVALGGGELTDRALGLIGVTRAGSPTAVQDAVRGRRSTWGGTAVGLGLGLVALVVVGPLVTYVVGSPPRFDELPCATEKEAVYVRVSAGSFLRIVEDSQGSAGRLVVVPEIRAADLQKAMGSTGMKSDMSRLTPGSTMMNTYDLKSGRFLWLVVPTDMLPTPQSIVRICGHSSADAKSRAHGMFYADSIQRATSP